MKYRLLLTVLIVSSMCCGGCEEPIRTYQVPVSRLRLLGAIVFPNRDDVWFFKLMGDAELVTAEKERFEQFIRSLKFPGSGTDPVGWTIPEGWAYEPGRDLRYATFRLPNRLEVTVFKFGSEGNKVLSNVNRWREQLKLEPISGEELLKICRWEKIAGELEVLMVDMESARYAPVPEETSEGDAPVQYKTPNGWVEKSSGVAFAVATFAISDGPRSAEVTITPLSGSGGSLAANINRWRRQIGLPEATDEELIKTSQVIEGASGRFILVNLVGPSGRSIVGAIRPGEEQTWFVKMTGDSELVARERETFESFVKTLRLRGGRGQ
jgi:hypothetical protein